MSFKIAPDVPQALLSVFSQIDFEKASGAKKKGLIMALESWAGKHVPLKNPNKTYSGNGEKKKISGDFDRRLLDALNKYDYEGLDLGQIVAWLDAFIKKALPLKKKEARN